MLKKISTTKPMLVAPNLDRKIRMEVDMSYFTIGGVLSMEYEDKSWRLVVYLSKSLNETEGNYEIHNKEMLTVIRELEA